MINLGRRAAFLWCTARSTSCVEPVMRIVSAMTQTYHTNTSYPFMVHHIAPTFTAFFPRNLIGNTARHTALKHETEEFLALQCIV